MAETRNIIRWLSEGVEKVRSDYATINTSNDATAKSTSNLSRTQRNLAMSSATLNSGLAALGRTLLVYAAPIAIGAAIKSGLDLASSIHDGAVAAGISVEAYQRLKFAMGEAGVSAEAFDKALATFREKLGQAATGNKTLAAAFEALGVNMAGVRSGAVSMERAFDTSIRSLMGYENAAERASRGQEVMGKGAKSLAVFLAEGTSSMDDAVAAADKLGIVLSAELINKAEQAGDKIDALATVMKMKLAVAVAENSDKIISFADGFIGLIQRLTDAGTALDGYIEKHQQLARVLAVIGEIQSSLDPAMAAVTGGKWGRFDFSGAMDSVDKQFSARNGVTSNGRGATGTWGGASGNWAAGSSGGAVTGDDAGSQLAAAEKAAKAAEDWQKKVAEGWATLYENVEKVTADFYTQVANDAREAMDAEDKAYRQRQDNIKNLIADIELETQLMSLSNDERERTIALLKMEGDGASADQIGRFNAAFDANKIAAAAKKAADDVEAIWTEAAQGVNDAWSDFLFDIFDKGKFKFGDFAKSLKSIWARTLADMIALSTQQSIVAPLFSALFGGMPGAGGAAGTQAAFSGLGGGLLGKLFGGGSSSSGGSIGGEKLYAQGASGGIMGTKIGGSTLGGVLGGGMMGYAVGGMAGSGQVGAVGGMIGTAIGGPIGSIIGGIVGGLIGSLFKSTPKSISSYGTGGVIDSMASGGLDVKIGKDMASGVIRALRTFSEQLVTGLENDSFLGIVGQRGKKFFFQAQESDIKSAGKGKYGAVKFDSAEEAIAAAIEAAINSGVVKGLTDADKKLMRAATSVEQAMQDVIASHNFKRELDFQFAGLSSPLAEGQARLEFEYQQQLILAEKYEADKTKLEAIYAQKRLDLAKQYNDQQNAAMEQSLGGLKDYLFDLTGGSASPLSPTNRLNLAQTRYSDIRSRALGGDADAIAALQGASQDFLSASQSVFGSSAGFQSNYQNVVATLSQITGTSNPLGTAANTTAAVNDNTRYQAQWFTQAATQRETTNAKLDTLITLFAPVAAALGRGSAMPVQNGTVQVGALDWAAISQAVGSLR